VAAGILRHILLAGIAAPGIIVLVGCQAAYAPRDLCKEHPDYCGPSPVPQPSALAAPVSLPVAPSVPAIASTTANRRSEIALHRAGGTYTVRASINGVMTLDFILDSGATDVSIPADVVMTLIRTGTIDRSDFLGSRTYMLADGSTAPSPIFRIRSLRVGNREVQNVTASIGPVRSGLLLGQSFLRHFTSWSIDNGRGVLVLD
jgi:clan AA aspartic protease (TIGR02281 family)